MFATFLPSIRNDFVSYDDPEYVTSNIHVQDGLTWNGVKWAFTTNRASNWHPLTWLSHMLDCQLYGLQPWWHHLTSILLHSLSTVILFLALRRMTGSLWRSVFVAAVFGLHPLRVESVTWISERKDVLSTLFWMLTLWAYAVYAEKSKVQLATPKRSEGGSPKSSVFYGAALLFFALGLLSKPMVVTLPFVLLLLDYWPLERWKQTSIRRLAAEKIPFFLAAGVASAITFLVQRHAGAVQVELSFASRLENAVVSYCRYIGKQFFPIDLCAPYPRPDHWPAMTAFLSVALLICVTGFVLMRWRRQPYLATGWFWFLGTLVPVIGLVQVGDQAMADRYTYVPLIGIILMFTWGVYELTKGWRNRGIVLGTGGLAAVLVCIPLTRHQIGYWKNGMTLFAHAVDVTEDNYLALTGLGVALQERGFYDEAIEQFSAALKLEPADALAHFNMGITLDKKGLYDEAISEFVEALKPNPSIAAEIRNNLGLTLASKGLYNEAINQLQEAMKLKPGNASPVYNMGYVLNKMERFDEAIPYLEQALKMKPKYPEAHYHLGIALNRVGKPDEAIGHFQEAAKLEPASPDIRYNFGNALARVGRLDEAIAQFEEAVRLDTNSVDAHNNLGVLLTRERRFNEAIFHFQEVLRLKPDFSEARTNLAAVEHLKDSLSK